MEPSSDSMSDLNRRFIRQEIASDMDQDGEDGADQHS